MGVKKYNPATPGFRLRTVTDKGLLSDVEPEKSLLRSGKNRAGRNNTGKITVRHRGGGNKRLYRVIDFKRDKFGVIGEVKTIEYDPNRSANIALVQYRDGEKRYMLAPEGLGIGQFVTSGDNADIKVGNALSLGLIPAGTNVHNIELQPGKGGQLVRSAGSYGVVMAKGDKYATIKMPSGEVRLILLGCVATIGQLGNADHRNSSKGKAGSSRWNRRRPSVRGSVMNACDHPHGGGEGKAPVGHSGPRTPWGKPALGYKTRKKKKLSNKFIVNKKK